MKLGDPPESGGLRPKWRNWQTRRTQNPLSLRACGFESHLRYKQCMRITRLFTGTDGESHFEDQEVEICPQGEIGALSARYLATGVVFRETTGDYDYDWHNAPARQYVVMLEGSVEIQVGDGTRRRFGPGDILLAEDTTGRGHQSRAVDHQPRRSLFITLD